MTAGIERARELLRASLGPTDWDAVLPPDAPPAARELVQAFIAAVGRGDIEWLLERTVADVYVAQPPDLPGGRTYRGRDEFVQALIDWPSEWAGFRWWVLRVDFPGPDRMLMVTRHVGRGLGSDIEVETEITWVFTFRDGLMARWEMFSSEAAARRAAAPPG